MSPSPEQNHRPKESQHDGADAGLPSAIQNDAPAIQFKKIREWEKLAAHAEACIAHEDLDDALKFAKAAVHFATANFGEQSIHKADSLDLLGRTYIATGDRVLAESNLIEALQLRDALGKTIDLDTATLCKFIGDLCIERCAAPHALAFYARARTILGTLPQSEPSLLIQACFDESLAHTKCGHLEAAAASLEQAFQQGESLSPKRTLFISAVFTNAGDAFMESGCCSQAVQIYRKALDAFNQSKNTKEEDRDRVEHALATALSYNNDFDEAEKLYKFIRARQRALHPELSPPILVTDSHIAEMYSLKGEPFKGEEIFRRNLKLAEESSYGNDNRILYHIIKLADSCRSNLEIHEARQLAERALRSIGPEDATEAAECHEILGACYDIKMNGAKAREHYTKAIELISDYRDLDPHFARIEAMLQLNLTRLSLNEDSIDQAESECSAALSILDSLHEYRGLPWIQYLSSAAEIEMHKGNFDQCRELLEKALALGSELGKAMPVRLNAALLSEIGELDLKCGDIESGIETLRQVKTYMEENKEEETPTMLHVLHLLSGALRSLGETDEADQLDTMSSRIIACIDLLNDFQLNSEEADGPPANEDPE